MVQVSREAVKTKAPSLTACFGLTGKYLVLTCGNRTVGYSGKLSGVEKTRLKAWTALHELPEDARDDRADQCSGCSGRRT